MYGEDCARSALVSSSSSFVYGLSMRKTLLRGGHAAYRGTETTGISNDKKKLVDVVLPSRFASFGFRSRSKDLMPVRHNTSISTRLYLFNAMQLTNRVQLAEYRELRLA